MTAPRTQRRRRPTQGALRFRTWGGKREGAGRKPAPGPTRVSHRPRPALATRFPVHVTLRLAAGLPNLRARDGLRTLQLAFARAAERPDFRLVHYCVQKNHIHLLVEARDHAALGRGMQGLSIRVAKRLNLLWQRRGSVFADRYHGRILRTPAETRAALSYVLCNTRRHTPRQQRAATWLDPCSSAVYLDGWRGFTPSAPAAESPPVAAPRTWLLRVGWRRLGLLVPDARPGPTRRASRTARPSS
jgi:REP element-mobilizing transposase RayT